MPPARTYARSYVDDRGNEPRLHLSAPGPGLSASRYCVRTGARPAADASMPLCARRRHEAASFRAVQSCSVRRRIVVRGRWPWAIQEAIRWRAGVLAVEADVCLGCIPRRRGKGGRSSVGTSRCWTPRTRAGIGRALGVSWWGRVGMGSEGALGCRRGVSRARLACHGPRPRPRRTQLCLCDAVHRTRSVQLKLTQRASQPRRPLQTRA